MLFLSDNLIAAGTLYATETKTKHEHVNQLTEKWKNMAALLEKTYLLNQLSSVDVASNELYYHRRCKTKFDNECRDATRKKSTEDQNEEWIKELTWSKMVCYVRETTLQKPNIKCRVTELDEMYKQSLASHNIHYCPHSTRFTEELKGRIPGL